MLNTNQEFTINAIAFTTDYNGKESHLYAGNLIDTLNYAATFYDRDSGDAYQGYYFANKFRSVTVVTDPDDQLSSVTLAVFTPQKRAHDSADSAESRWSYKFKGTSQ